MVSGPVMAAGVLGTFWLPVTVVLVESQQVAFPLVRQTRLAIARCIYRCVDAGRRADDIAAVACGPLVCYTDTYGRTGASYTTLF